MIDRGELGAVRAGRRRIRIRQPQLDDFPHGWRKVYEGKQDDTPWFQVPVALTAVAAAIAAEDREAVEIAIGDRHAAAGVLP
jgi:hypothetical protein